MRFEKFIPYHIVSRAIERKEIFIAEEDALRFIFQMYVANRGRPAFNLQRQDIKKAALAILNGEEVPKKFIIIEHPPLVDCLSFSLVINHHHDILISNTDEGISKYLQKLHNGFAKYFNLKHRRQTALFARPYKIIPIQTELQLNAVIRYVNVKNPLDVYQPNWLINGLKNEKEALDFLHNYQFSSFPDLFGKRNSKILAPPPTLERYLGKETTRKDFMEFIKDYLQKNLVSFEPFFLE